MTNREEREYVEVLAATRTSVWYPMSYEDVDEVLSQIGVFVDILKLEEMKSLCEKTEMVTEYNL